MFKTSRLAALLIASAVVSLPALAADKEKAIATVNGKAVSQAAYNMIISEQLAKGTPDSPELQNAIKNQLIANELVAQAAIKNGADKKPEVKIKYDLAKQAILINAYLSEYVQAHPISEAQLKAEYDVIKTNLGGTEYKSRHILVATEDEAKAIIAKLNDGEKFSDLAKQSKDPGSKDKGGDLGWSSPNAYVPAFGEALTKLEKGKYTKTPVKSDFGYHVIMLEDTRASTPPPFDQLKPQLQQRATQRQIEQMVEELRSKAKIN